jgi:hypothetical protein
VIWVAAKLLLLVTLGIVASFIHKFTQQYNEAEDKPELKVNMKYLLIGLIGSGTGVMVLQGWFVWVMGAYCKYIMDNMVLPPNAEFNDHYGERRGSDLTVHPWTVGYLLTSGPRKATVTPNRPIDLEIPKHDKKENKDEVEGADEYFPTFIFNHFLHI